MIRYDVALDKIDFCLEKTVLNDAEQNRLAAIISDLPQSTVRFIAYMAEYNTTLPELTLPALIQLVQNEDGNLDWFNDRWLRQAKLTMASLSDAGFRKRCLFTLCHLFEQTDPSTALEVCDQLERISEQMLYFAELPEAEALFYRKMYLASVCLYIDSMGKDRLEFFMISQLTLLALINDVEVMDVLGKAIRSLLIVDHRRDLSIDLATDLSLNKTQLGTNAKKDFPTISDWIKKLTDSEILVKKIGFVGLNGWLNADPDFLANDAYAQVFITRLCIIHLALVSGYFILEYHGMEEFEHFLEQAKAQTEPETAAPSAQKPSFPQELKNHTQDFAVWITTPAAQELAAEWMQSFGDAAVGYKNLSAELQKTFPDLTRVSPEILQALVSFSAQLQETPFGKDKDLVYFDQANARFDWLVT